jgi:hypothetical protein
MSGRFGFLAALLGSGAATTAAAPAAASGTDPFASLELDDTTRAALGTELSAFVAERESVAAKAANDRAVKVMGSDKGKANPASALALLGNDKLSALSADDIIAAIPEAPAAPSGSGADAAAAAAAGNSGPEAGGGTGGSKAHQERLAGAPKLALGNAASTDATVEETDAGKTAGKEKAIGLWGSVQGKSITAGGRGGNDVDVRVGAAQ